MAAVVVAVVCLVGMPGAASAAPGTAAPRTAEGDVRLTDPRITESSGLALSRAHPHTVWTVNDSGDSARVFAVDTRTGETVGVHTFGAPVRDVEALAITPEGRMLVADIGDNTASREVVRVFWFEEPALGDTSGGWASWELSYPDGPHDAEALAAHPTSGRIQIVTKASDGSAGVYALPREPSRSGINRLTRVAAAPGLVTDAVYLDDGSALAVRTYTSLELLDPSTWRSTARRGVPLQPQGETVALAPGRRDLLVGSEGARSRLHRVAVPAVSASTATPATRSPAPTPMSQVVPTVPGTSPSTSASPRRTAPPVDADGPWLALGLGGLALLAVAGLAARLARRRSPR